MRHPTVRSATTAMFVVMVLVGANAPALAVNGHAVSACWRYCINSYNPCVPEIFGVNGYFWRGKIIRVDITDNEPTHCDTIFPGLAQYPTLSFDGTKVAFFRLGCRIEGDALTGNCDSVYISVVNSDGTNMRDLVGMTGSTIVGFADQECSIDWPAGDWIYYYRVPMSGAEIWRVNVNDPSSNEFVVKYVGTDAGFYMRRWSLSVDGKYAGGQFKELACGGNSVHTFPPPNGDACASMPSGGSFPGCNGAISAGGHYFGTYIGGCHDQLVISSWDHESNSATWSIKQVANGDIQAGFGSDMAVCAEMIRWSANSEKWVLQGTGWHGHADGMRYGGNQLLVNWVDEVGFPVTRNPNQPLSSSGYEVPGEIYYQNDPGDFWVSDGPAGCYEDIDGNWVNLETTNLMTAARSAATARGLSVTHGGASVVLSLPGVGVRCVRVVDAHGRTVLQRTTAESVLVMPASSMRGGAYFVRVSGNGLVVTNTVTVCR